MRRGFEEGTWLLKFGLGVIYVKSVKSEIR